MVSKVKTLNRTDLADVILGAHFYACGGGGAQKNGEELLKEIDKLFASTSDVQVQYIDIHEVQDTDQLPVLAAMGAPQKFLQKGYRSSPVTAFNDLEKTKNTTFSTLSPVETGPIAYGMSLLVAADRKIPIINGDGGGRAFPCLQLSTFANLALESPIAVSPCVLTSEKYLKEDGGVIAIGCKSSADVDAMTRGIISQSKSFDDRASLASFAMTGRQLKQTNAVVPGMLLKAKALGQHIRQCIEDQLSCFDVIETLDGAQCVMKGRLNNIITMTGNGFDWVAQEYQQDHSGKKYYVISQNENMILWADDLSMPVAMAPDLICCLSSDASLMSNDEIIDAWKADQDDPRLKEMAIFTVDAAPQINQPWFHEHFSEIFRRFGYFGNYHPPIQHKMRG
ncbi:S-methyl thiohydantoin desulfurase domain-containing protein [Vibrio spartinae]|uniref:DUF917 domain-containing protein n=1 Tax=Vibrio spartinae TaxID=1918945 RepID=A0A1N6M752_9VIBR|nr:DUF917 family protein [Vibrio spartinae]QMV13926.1 hypothetical protein Vspart_01173 [Vibrio spartinae]SIO95190.1 hypothetical protein VSP9026_02931 [Vibrio spartinae]